MIPGDIIGMPVDPSMPRACWSWADAKVTKIAGAIIELEWIAGPQDGRLMLLSRHTLDAILEREGGDEWKDQPEGGG